MKKSLVSIVTLACFIASCGSTPKKETSYYKGGRSQKYYPTKESNDDSIDDALYQSLQSHSRGGIHYSKYLNQNKKWDIPFTRNQYVEKWINYYMGAGRKSFSRHLARSGRYIPYIHKVLEQYGMPKDIAYLAMIESGFNVRAQSWASAVGPWQFIRSTGAMYGLEVDYYIDERRDPEKATHAAARHLKDLYNEFGDWYLAFAAYNAGAGKVRGAIIRNGNDYWDMVRGNYLRQETKDYVPKLLAAAEIAKNPEKYGFNDIQYQAYIPMEVVYMQGPTDLEVAAECAGVDADLIRLLNPELLHDITPPHISNYALKIPSGTKAQFKKRYAALKPYQRSRTLFYVAQKGDTVSSIASRYGVTVKDLAKANPGKVETLKSYQVKKTKVAVAGRGKRKRYAWKQEKYAVYSYNVNPGSQLNIPQNRSLSGYSSLRDDEAALRAQGKYTGSAASDIVNSAAGAVPDSKKPSKSAQKENLRQAQVQKVQNSTERAWQVTDSVLQDLSKPKTPARQDLPATDLGPDISSGPSTQNAPASPTTFQRNDEFYSLAPRVSAQPTEAQLRAAVQELHQDLNSEASSVAIPYSDQKSDLEPEDNSEDPQDSPSMTNPQLKRVIGMSSQPATSSQNKAAQKNSSGKIQYHVVKAGETLTGIADQYNVSIEDLKAWNGSKVHPTLLRGAKLQIRNGKTQIATQEKASVQSSSKKTSQYYTIQRGDTLSDIAKQFGVSTTQLKEWNGSKVHPVLQAGAKIAVVATKASASSTSSKTSTKTKPQVVKYKVKVGDNLTTIARQHDTTPEEIKKLNNLKSHVIKPGSVLVVKK